VKEGVGKEDKDSGVLHFFIKKVKGGGK